LDELSSQDIIGNTVKYNELRKKLAKVFESQLDKPIATGVLGLPKIPDNAVKIKNEILSVLPPELTPSKYKTDARRQASESAPSTKVEVFNKLTTIGLTSANYEDKLNNPDGNTPAEKYSSLARTRNTILDAFNVPKDKQIRSKTVSAHSQAKKDTTLGETNDNHARARLLSRDLIAFMKSKLVAKTEVKKGDTPAKRPPKDTNEPKTIHDLEETQTGFKTPTK
jgi:hypothetical protein